MVPFTTQLYHLQNTLTLLGKDLRFSPSASREGLELVNQTNGTKNFGRLGKNEKNVIPRKIFFFFARNFYLDEPFHLNFPWNYWVFHQMVSAQKLSQVEESPAQPGYPGRTNVLYISFQKVENRLRETKSWLGEKDGSTFCDGDGRVTLLAGPTFSAPIFLHITTLARSAGSI